MGIVEGLRSLTEHREVQEIQRRPASEILQAQRDAPVPPPTPPQPKGLYQQGSKFMDLPLDMILTIFDRLEVHDAVALSLTCKGLYQHLFADARIRFKNTSREGREEVQTMLEKDLPYDQIYCGFCGTFHTMYDDYRSTVCLENRQPGVSAFATQVPGILTSKLTFLDARAILNVMLFKRPDGKNILKALERKTSAGTVESPWTQHWEFKRLDGPGDLLATVTSTHSRFKATRDNEKFTYSVCKHIHLLAEFPNMLVNRPDLSRTFICPEGDFASGTCLACHAHWDLWLRWSKDWKSWNYNGWKIEIKSWHRLGRLRSPSDPIWARNAGEYWSPEYRVPGIRWDKITPNYITFPRNWMLHWLRCSY